MGFLLLLFFGGGGHSRVNKVIHYSNEDFACVVYLTKKCGEACKQGVDVE